MKFSIRDIGQMTLIGSIFTLLSTLSVESQAFDYYDDRPLVFTFQNKAGFWFACGPVQCIQAGERSESKAVDYVVQDHHGSLDWSGNSGRCKFYIGDGELKSYDHSPRKLIEWHQKCC